MALELRMPRFSEEMKEATIIRWLKAVGEPVAQGEPVAEVETEKVIVEIEAPAEGVMLEILAQEQQVVPVDGLICRIGEPGEQPATVLPGAVPPAGNPALRTQAAVPRAPAEPPPTHAAPPSNVVPLVTRPRETPRTQPAAALLAVERPVSPLARRVAQELDIDLALVTATGIGGKIVLADLHPHLPPASQGNLALPRTLPQSQPLAVQAHSVTGQPEPAASGFTDAPPSALRRAVAQRMAQSKASIPHFYMTVEADVTDLLALRARLNAPPAHPEQPGPRLTVNDMLIKAAALALQQVPELNATLTGDAGGSRLRRYAAVHMGFAVATEEGLFTPVVHDCQAKTLGQIAAETRDLIQRAKSRTLKPEHLQGGTFTLSNMGMFDVLEFTAIINPPQVAILAVARPQRQALNYFGRSVLRQRVRCTVSADHRALDGVTVARFLQALKAPLEQPERLLL